MKRSITTTKSGKEVVLIGNIHLGGSTIVLLKDRLTNDGKYHYVGNGCKTELAIQNELLKGFDLPIPVGRLVTSSESSLPSTPHLGIVNNVNALRKLLRHN